MARLLLLYVLVCWRRTPPTNPPSSFGGESGRLYFETNTRNAFFDGFVVWSCAD